MIYKCSCGRVIASIRDLNNLKAMGKSIKICGNNLKVICKCKKENSIYLTPYQN